MIREAFMGLHIVHIQSTKLLFLVYVDDYHDKHDLLNETTQ